MERLNCAPTKLTNLSVQGLYLCYKKEAGEKKSPNLFIFLVLTFKMKKANFNFFMKVAGSIALMKT